MQTDLERVEEKADRILTLLLTLLAEIAKASR